MSILVSIDPGLRAAGLAIFTDGQLTRAELVRVDDGEGITQWRNMVDALLAITPDGTTALAVEEMMFRDKQLAAVPRILPLAYIGGMFIGAFAPEVEVTMVNPHVWTAGLGKAKNEERILRRLSAEELAVLEAGCKLAPKYNRKELVDAVGIGLFAQKRL